MNLRLKTIFCRIPAGCTGGMTLLRTLTLMGGLLAWALVLCGWANP
ncbi:MAG TPA: hypothetical protein VMK84_32520 [Streptosporangiaceae bacterium]|nr:hypothetical protein [Streptosporangiaceae bacterium]